LIGQEFYDAPMQITDVQRKKLCELIYFAFLEIRLLGYESKSEQASDLADAFHNLPRDMWKEDFSLESFRDLFLKSYQEKYSGKRIRDYVAAVNGILAAGEDPEFN
jgi:hypothetical protein